MPETDAALFVVGLRWAEISPAFFLGFITELTVFYLFWRLFAMIYIIVSVILVSILPLKEIKLEIWTDKKLLIKLVASIDIRNFLNLDA